MKAQQQLHQHDPENGVFGDCYRTAIAIILDKNAEEVPHVCEKGETNIDDLDGLIAMRTYLRGMGLTISKSVYNGELSWAGFCDWMQAYNPENAIIVTGKATRGVNHCVVMIGGNVVCDPITGTPNQEALIGPAQTDNEMHWWVETITTLAHRNVLEVAV